MNKIRYVIRNLLFSGFVLYGYNLIAVDFNMMIPINLTTLIGIFFLGVPGLIGLVLFKLLIL